jgi:hypothetical protein
MEKENDIGRWVEFKGVRKSMINRNEIQFIAMIFNKNKNSLNPSPVKELCYRTPVFRMLNQSSQNKPFYLI